MLKQVQMISINRACQITSKMWKPKHNQVVATYHLKAYLSAYHSLVCIPYTCDKHEVIRYNVVCTKPIAPLYP